MGLTWFVLERRSRRGKSSTDWCSRVIQTPTKGGCEEQFYWAADAGVDFTLPDSITGGQTLTIAYNNGTFADGTSAAGYPIGTAAVLAGGTWALDLVSTGRLDPNNATVWSVRPTRIQVTSPLGGSATSNISLK